MRKHVLLYGLLCGVLIAGLQLIEYRWIVVEHSVEIYGGLVAAVFASVGIWLGLRLTPPIGYPTMVLAFLMVYFGVRSYRDNVAGGRAEQEAPCQL